MPGYELWDDQEKRQLSDVLETGVLMRYNFDAQRKGHWKTKSFEKALEQRLNVGYAHACSSGTAALTTALAALGVGYGDEVILPTYTFVASFEAVLSVGAIPIFTNVDESLTLDIKAIEQNISSRTKVIMPVHMCGSMADMNGIMALAQKYNLLVLEDACQSIGGTYEGKYLGSIGDAGTFSFDFVKMLTCGEGGAVVTNNKDLYEKIHPYTDHGHDHIGTNRGAEHHPFVGYNFRMNELSAAVGLAQISKLDFILQKQKKYHDILTNELLPIKDLALRTIHDVRGNTHAFLSLILPTEAHTRKVSLQLKEAGIDHAYWYDNHWHYLRKWEHLKDLRVLCALAPDIQKRFQKHIATYDVSPSDKVLSRTLSFLIKLSPSEEDMMQQAKVMAQIIRTTL